MTIIPVVGWDHFTNCTSLHEYRVYVKPLMMTLRLMIAMASAIIPMESVLQTIFIVTILLTAIILETHAKPYVRYHKI